MYSAHEVDSSKEAQTKALDDMEKMLRQGIDVPIRVEWNGGGGHAMLVSDVRDQAPARLFLITDPWNGRTEWKKEEDLVNGDSNFMGAGNGQISHMFTGTSK